MPVLSDGTVYRRAGAGTGRPVVLIHGLGLCQDMWQWTRPALEDAYDVIGYDLYGHGESAPPPRRPDLALFSEQLDGLLRELGLAQAAIVGFSLGGMICRRFALDHPAKARALAILNSPHRRTPVAQEAVLARVEQARAEGPGATVEAALERWFTDDFRRNHPEVTAQVRRWVLANDPEIYPSVYRVLACGIDEITGPGARLCLPALVLTGAEDFGNGPEMTRAIAEDIAGGRALILPGLRHMALAEDPDAVNRPLRAFLDDAFARAPIHPK